MNSGEVPALHRRKRFQLWEFVILAILKLQKKVDEGFIHETKSLPYDMSISGHLSVLGSSHITEMVVKS